MGQAAAVDHLTPHDEMINVDDNNDNDSDDDDDDDYYDDDYS